MPDTDLTLLREYEPHELGEDGYPLLWHDGISEDDPEDGTYGVKHLVRAEAGHRCERCGHPYAPGDCGGLEIAGAPSRAPAEATEQFAALADAAAIEREVRQKGVHWSPCDERCTHGGPMRARNPRHPEEIREWLIFEAGDVRDLVGRKMEVQAAWRILTVHHLNGRKHDLRWWNLAALCQRCHLAIQRKVVMERVWPAEHTEWFKPHAAGWYAYCYLGETITRAQALDRMDELLALEQAA